MAGVFFGKRDTTRGLAKWVARRTDLHKTYDVLISHSQCPEEAERLGELMPTFGLKINRVCITDTGSVIGAHTGPGSLIMALQAMG